MKRFTYSKVAQRWEVTTNFDTDMGVAFNWQSPVPTTTEPMSFLTVSRTITHPSYNEATNADLQLLIKCIFMANRINVWDSVKWDS